MTKEEVIELLKSKGVWLDIGACGCCDSPWVSIKIDGKLVVDDDQGFTLRMIGNGDYD